MLKKKVAKLNPLAVSKLNPKTIDPALLPGMGDVLSPANPNGVQLTQEALDFWRAYKKYGFTMSMVELRDHLGVNAMGVANFDNILLDAQHKSLLKGYREEPRKYVALVSRMRSAQDFKTIYGIRANELNRFESVNERQVYSELTFGDEKVSYSVAKYGNLLSWSFEALTNDDLGVLMGRQPERWGRAAARTLNYWAFYTMLDANPTIYDDVALFHDGSHSNDLGSSRSFGQANLEAANLKMMSQTDPVGNNIEINPRVVVHHSSIIYTVQKILQLQREDSEIYHQNVFTLPQNRMSNVVTNYITSTTWFVVGDKNDVDLMEMAFLRGKDEPEIWWEPQNTGRGLMQDEVVTKCRLIFGGAWLDYRGVVRANA